MKWGRKNKSTEEKKTKNTTNKASSFSSSSHSFQLSHFFPFSWISRQKQEKQGRTSPKQFPPISSDAPRRRSTGDENRRPDRLDIARSARHHSLGSEFELELRPISSFRKCDDYTPPPTPLKRTEARWRGQKIRPKVRALSPKTTGRKAGESEKRKRRNLESFAVVKRSINPQKDFRESMLEMIREKEMRRPEELKRLLACYISLNRDENHDFIIKAFRQVLFAGDCHCSRCCDCF